MGATHSAPTPREATSACVNQAMLGMDLTASVSVWYLHRGKAKLNDNYNN